MTAFDATAPPVTAAPSPRGRGSSSLSADLQHGQAVIVTARWLLVGAGLLLALWNPGSVGELRVQLGSVLLLAGANFALHAQLLMRRPLLEGVIYAASLADLALISILILSKGGFRSELYVFYFPALLALAVAFPRAVTLTVTAATLVVYGLIGLATAPPGDGSLQAILTRLLMLAAVATCGQLYQRVEARRRRLAPGAHEAGGAP
jgi:hypothetical protein